MATKTDDNQNDAEPEEIVDVDQEKRRNFNRRRKY